MRSNGHSQRAPLVFISYRRHDSAGAARWLYAALQQTFGPGSVFMDVEAIRGADRWAKKIDAALARATAVLAVIGPHWLRITDEFGRRRLEREDDWVRNELRHALECRKPLLPVLLSKTPMPARVALPGLLHGLVDHQAFDLRDDRWEQDMSALLAVIQSLGLERSAAAKIRYPTPKVRLAELTPEEMAKALRRLPGWEQVPPSPLPGRGHETRVELRRVYEFATFEDAIEFMGRAAVQISKVQHHPRWENVWRSVTVWLTTWDIGFRPSVLDIEVARELNALFAEYDPHGSKKRRERAPRALPGRRSPSR